jgi:hypothetical protein
MRVALASAIIAAAVATVTTSPAAAEQLSGESYDYHWDGKDIGHPERAWWGRAYVPPSVAATEEHVPLVVFLHGLNKALIKYRWMGGGTEGDVRAIIGDMVDAETIGPVVVAGPSSIIKSQVSQGASWNRFDLDHFIDSTMERLDGIAEIDEERIVVAGHSGAGCSDHGGLGTALASRRRLLALVAIDTCMSESLAERWSAANPLVHVLVSYQTAAWKNRPFAAFKRVFEEGVAEHPPAEGVLRALDHQKPAKAPHDATVALTFEHWLPKLGPPLSQEES